MKLQYDRRQSSWRSILLLAVLVLAQTTIEAARTEEAEETQRRRLAKPWYVRDIEWGSVKLPVSPVTLVVVVLSLYWLVSSWNSGPVVWCEASHILVSTKKDPDPEKKLEQLKQQIGKSEARFAAAAGEHSECPSRANGGRLGRFQRGEMAPGFDRACFDRTTAEQQAVGPIETMFGWHLIYIHHRKLD